MAACSQEVLPRAAHTFVFARSAAVWIPDSSRTITPCLVLRYGPAKDTSFFRASVIEYVAITKSMPLSFLSTSSRWLVLMSCSSTVRPQWSPSHLASS